ncbi:MAG: vWA domain-containing protein [Chloroflexota bacterium]
MSTFEKIRKAALARLDAGEPAEIILQDYADFEDELRPVLEAETGKRLAPLAGSSMRSNKPKNASTVSNNLILVGAGAVLLVMLAVGALFILPLNSNDDVIVVQPATAIPDVQATPIPPTAVNAQVDNPPVQTSATCDGIPDRQITSQFVLNPIPQQSNTDSDRAPELGMADGAVLETSVSSEEMADDVVMDVEEDYDYDDDYAYEEDYAYDETEADYESAEDVALAPPSDAGESASGEVMATSTALTLSSEEAPRTTANTTPEEPLRAGEIDDNAEWDTYQDYRTDFLDTNGTRDVVDVDTTGRQVIRVVDSEGNPVLNACVQIYNGESFITSSLTYATGMTLFFPNLDDSTRYIDEFRVVVSKGDVMVEDTIDRTAIGDVTEITLDVTESYESVPLDIVFLLDATGSMSDEIQQLQDNIMAISAQIDALPGDVDVRYGLVTYRDRGDAYVTRVHDFVDNVADFQESLSRVQAGGGGDYPESLNEGLDMALNAVEWRDTDAVQLVFLVADAPPHVDYQDDADYSLLMADAMARGVKIHTIASSGLQPEGEFILRQIAQYTMGRFLFLTYEDGVAGTAGDERPDLEVGDPEDEQGVGDYSVSQLDELVIQLIRDEISVLTGEE